MGLPKWLQTLKVLGPMVLAVAVPGVGPLLAPIIVAAIAEAEKMPGASGAAKKAAALELVKAGAQSVNVATKGKVTIDPDEAVATATGAIDTTVGVINLITKAIPDAPASPA